MFFDDCIFLAFNCFASHVTKQPKSPRQTIYKINKNGKFIVISGFFISDVIYIEDTDLVLIFVRFKYGHKQFVTYTINFRVLFSVCDSN